MLIVKKTNRRSYSNDFTPLWEKCFDAPNHVSSYVGFGFSSEVENFCAPSPPLPDLHAYREETLAVSDVKPESALRDLVRLTLLLLWQS